MPHALSLEYFFPPSEWYVAIRPIAHIVSIAGWSQTVRKLIDDLPKSYHLSASSLYGRLFGSSRAPRAKMKKAVARACGVQESIVDRLRF